MAGRGVLEHEQRMKLVFGEVCGALDRIMHLVSPTLWTAADKQSSERQAGSGRAGPEVDRCEQLATNDVRRPDLDVVLVTGCANEAEGNANCSTAMFHRLSTFLLNLCRNQLGRAPKCIRLAAPQCRSRFMADTTQRSIHLTIG